MVNTKPHRSMCTINFALETFGDGWSLLIVRDIIYFGKSSFGEFLQSDESISSNTLTRRLSQLEQAGILSKKSDPTDKRKDIYYLTDRGLDLIPILLELGNWGDKHSNYEDAPQRWIRQGKVTREELIALARETVKNGSSLYNGPDSMLKKLGVEGNKK